MTPFLKLPAAPCCAISRHFAVCFSRRGGVKRRFLRLRFCCFFFLGATYQTQGQECQDNYIDDCNTTLKVEIVRQYQNVSTSSTCPTDMTGALCGNADRFRQMTYKVYLRYAPDALTPKTPFYLQYGKLAVVAGLEFNTSPSSTVRYSHIDVEATKICYFDGPGTSWDPNKVSFQIHESTQSVEILFMNDDPNSECGTVGEDAILFTWDAPPGVPVAGCPSQYGCAYAELFTVVVNAYAGETISVDVQASEFDPTGEGQEVCNPIPRETGNINNNGIAPTTISSPAAATNTTNDNLSLQLPAPVAVNGKQHFEIKISNDGIQALTFTYLEFVIKATSSKDISLSFSGNNLPSTPIISGNDRFLHYRIFAPGGTTINAGQAYSVGFIEVGPPYPANQGWSVTVTWVDESKSRVKTNAACTALPVPLPPSSVSNSYSTGGLPPCTSSPLFKVQAKDGVFDPCAATPAIVQAGFEIPSGQMNLTRLVFELEFELTGNLAITGVNYDDWISNWSCPVPNDMNCLPANSDDPCYDIVGNNIIRFCFATTTATPLVFFSNAFINIVFNTQPGCIKKTTIRFLEVGLANTAVCIPPISNALSNGTSNCPPNVSGNIATEIGQGVEDVTVALAVDGTPATCQQPASCVSSCDDSEQTTNIGDYGFCTCDDCQCFKVTPSKNDNPLNGVSTYDLVLISKHILGIEPLGSPYKIIAADANKSGAVTTVDIVEIRKLILGISTEFPNDNTSWRFVDADYSFPNPNNPFQPQFLEDKADIDAQAPGKANFVAVKVGDVNNTAIGGSRPENRPVVTLSWVVPDARAGDAVTVPVVYTGAEPLEAVQLGLRFDPAQLQLLSPSQGDLPGYHADNFNLNKAQEGEIRTLWLAFDPDDPELKIEPGTVLFHLTFKVLGALPDTGLPLWLDDAVLANAAWRPDGTECEVVNKPLPSERDVAPRATTSLLSSVRPNPTSGEVTFRVQAAKPGKGRIALFGPFGNRVFVRDVLLDTTEQEFTVPEIAQLPAGVYIWKVYSGGEKTQGHLVKQ